MHSVRTSVVLLGATLLILSAAARGEAPPKLVLLRDGRRVEGEVVARADGLITIHSKLGTMTFPAWLAEPNEDVALYWRFVQPVTGADDPALLAQLKERAAWMQAQRKNYRAPEADRQKLDAARKELDRLLQAKDVEGLVKLGESLLPDLPRVHESVRRDLLATTAHALDQAANLLVARRTRADIDRAAALQVKVYGLRFEGHYSGPVSVRNVLDDYFKEDPRLCRLGLIAMRQVEDFGALRDTEDQRWRRNRRGVTWQNKAPALFRATMVGGTQHTLEASPAVPDDILRVEVPRTVFAGYSNVMTNLGPAYKFESFWYRVFWCPVARQWKTQTVPERLLAASVPVCRFLDVHFNGEHRLAGDARGYLHTCNSSLDRFVRLYDARTNSLRDYGGRDRDLETLNRTVRGALDANERSLRYRAWLQPAFDRLDRIDAMRVRALKGEQVDPTPLMPPDPKSIKREAIVAILNGFDCRARADKLKGKAIRKLKDDAEIVALVLGLAKNEFVLFDTRRAAFALLTEWRHAAFNEWVKAELMASETPLTVAWYAGDVRAEPEWWARLLNKQRHYQLHKYACQRIGVLARDDERFAALLKKEAVTQPLPYTQLLALKALADAGRYDDVIATVCDVRYPAAREAVMTTLSSRQRSYARVLEVLVQAQMEARYLQRQGYGEKPPAKPIDAKAFREKYLAKLEEAKALAKLPDTPAVQAFLKGLDALLDAYQLSDDYMLQEFVERGSTICDKMHVTPRSIAWLKILVEQTTSSDTWARTRARIFLGEKGAVEGFLKQAADGKGRYDTHLAAIRMLSASNDPRVEKFLTTLMAKEKRGATNRTAQWVLEIVQARRKAAEKQGK